MNNDEKVKLLMKRRVLYYLILVFGFSTLVLALFSLFEKFTPIPAIITFLIEVILTKYRESLFQESKGLDSKNQE